MPARPNDVCEVFRWKRKRTSVSAAQDGWRFRFFRAGEEDSMYVSENVMPTADEALGLAGTINNLLFCGDYPVVLIQE